MNSKIKNIYLHVGVAKSATSSLQMSLLKSRDELMKVNGGYFYPKISYFHHGRLLHYMFMNGLPNRLEFIRDFDGNLDSFKDYLVKESAIFENEINNSDCENLIVSGEQIARLNANSLQKLKEYLLKLAPNATIYIVVCVREHTSRFTSKINLRIKIGGQFDLKKEIKKERNYYQRKLSSFMEVFSKNNMIVYSFNEIKNYKNGPIELFFSKINLKINDMKLINFRSNDGYSAVAIDIVKYINNRLPLITNDKLTRGREFRDTIYWGQLRGEKFKLINETIKEIHTVCMDDKIWLRDNFGIDYTDQYSKKVDYELEFKPEYFKQFKNLFVKVRPVIQKLSYDYINDKIMTGNVSGETKAQFIQLLHWMDKITSDYKQKNLEFFIDNNQNRYNVNAYIKLKTFIYTAKRQTKRKGLKKSLKLFKKKIKKKLLQ